MKPLCNDLPEQRDQVSAGAGALFLFLYLLLACFTLYGVFNAPAFGDETDYHVPLARSISLKTIMDQKSDYSSAYMPLPYIIGRIANRFADSIYTLRLVNWIVALASATVFWMILKKIATRQYELMLLFLSNPYFLRAASIYYATNYGILFGLLGVYFYIFSGWRYNYYISHFFMGLAVLSMQWMSMLYVAVFLYELNMYTDRKVKNPEQLLGMIFLKIVTLFPALCVAYWWGGITHPNFRFHALHPSFEALNILFAVLGFLFGVYVLFSIRNLNWKHFVTMVFVSPLLYLGQPVFSLSQGAGLFPGLESNLLRHIEVYFNIPHSLGLFVMVLSGFLFYLMFLDLDVFNEKHKIIYYLIIGLSIGYISAVILGSVQIYILVPFLLILFIRELEKSRTALRLMNIQWYVVGISYFFYYIFLKEHYINP